MATRVMTVQVRRGTTTDWAATDRVLLPGEIGCNTDTAEYRLGDGTTPWSGLKTVMTGTAANIPGIVEEITAVVDTLDLSGGVDSNLAHIVYMTATEYAALATKDSDTLYVVQDSNPPAMTYEWGRLLDTFSGATDDDKLTTAISYQQAQTYVTPIMLGPREYNFTSQRSQPQRAMRMIGVPGFNNTEKGLSFSGTKSYMGSRITLTLPDNTPWITSSQSTVFGLSIHNIAFKGTNKNVTVFGGGSTVWWTDSLRDLSFSDCLSVFGTQGSKRLITACVWDGGAWDIGNSYSGAVHIGGSDNTLWPAGGLVDSGTAYIPAALVDPTGQYHIWCDSLEKTTIGPIFVTAEGGWGGLLVSGPAFGAVGTNLGSVQLYGAKIEGRSPTQLSNGNLVRVSGGMLHASHTWIAYGMGNPTAQGHGTTDAGLVHVTNGGVSLSACTFHKASTQAETLPMVYQNAGVVRVRDIWAGSKDAAWTATPGFKSIGGTAVNDGTMATL